MALSLLVSSCVLGRVHVDHSLDETKIAALQRGVTTKAEVLAWFGPPQEIDGRELTVLGVSADALIAGRATKLPPERIITARYFRYTHFRANAFGVITLVFNYVDLDVKRDALLIFFDGEDKVEDFAFQRGTDELPTFGPLSR